MCVCVQVHEFGRSYWTRRRQIKASVSAFLRSVEHDDDDDADSSIGDECVMLQANIEGVNGLGCVQHSTLEDSEPCFFSETSNDNITRENCTSDDFDWTLFSDADSISSDESVDMLECTDDNDSNRECDMRSSIAAWAVQYDIPHVAVNALLRILQPYHNNLPVDSRTLLSTPRSTVIKKLSDDAEYIHFGITRGIEELVKSGHIDECKTHLQLQFNIDGLPLFKSSGMSIWPILCLIVPSSCSEPFVIGIYCGMTKPSDLNAYLADFIAEAREIVSSGIVIENKHFTVELNSFVCDAPARAMLKNVKSHGGYYACDKCVQEGEWHGKVTYPDTSASLRTDVMFDEMTNEEHHTGPSPLSSLPIGMVSGFPLDYMHLVCLGVMRRLLLCWLKGPLNTRLCASTVEKLSMNLVRFIPFIPREFSRKPRSVADIMRWKATELRQFLLYTGPVALLNILPQALYENFLLLFVGISLLVSPQLCKKNYDYADELLITCVENMKELYGKGMIVYNVHCLIHLAGDARVFGALDNFSAFPFENKLKSLKSLVRKPSFILQQIACRLHEKRLSVKAKPLQKDSNVYFKNEHYLGPVMSGLECCKQYRLVCFKGMIISLNVGDDCVAKPDGKPCIVRNILCSSGQTYLLVENFCVITSFFEYPLPSSSMHVYKVSQLNGVYELINLTDVMHKCVRLPLKGECFVILPLLHNT